MASPHLSDEYYATVGRATAAWAMLELCIDFIIGITFRKMGGDVTQAEIPRSLDKKLGYLRKVAKMPALKPWSAQLETLCDGTNRLKQRRHIIIHGFASNEMERGEWIVFKLRYEPLIHVAEHHPITKNDIIGFTGSTADLTVVALDIAEGMAAAIPKA
jgi:hypothetical protein